MGLLFAIRLPDSKEMFSLLLTNLCILVLLLRRGSFEGIHCLSSSPHLLERERRGGERASKKREGERERERGRRERESKGEAGEKGVNGVNSLMKGRGQFHTLC